MLRKLLANGVPFNDPDFRIRGHQGPRLENVSDAVFGFALTLLVVTLEVPRTYDELIRTMRGFPAFALSFLALMTVWHQHVTFFRRFAITDRVVVPISLWGYRARRRIRRETPAPTP